MDWDHYRLQEVEGNVKKMYGSDVGKEGEDLKNLG